MKSINIPGLLIEYIITGTVAYLWILLILINLPIIQNLVKDFSSVILLLAIPCAYVIGMIIDGIAYKLVKNPKKEIKRDEVENEIFKNILNDNELNLLRKLVDEKNVTDKLVIELNLKDQEGLINEINWRSSRDRISRGFIINSFLISLAITFSIGLQYFNSSSSNIFGFVLINLTGLILSLVLAYLVKRAWKNSEKLSTRFQFLTYIKVIQKKEILI